MRYPKTLLLTSTRPGVGSVGELFLLPLCRLFAPDKLVAYAGVANYDVPVPASDLSWMKIISRELPPEWPHQEPGPALLRRLRSAVRLTVLKSKLSRHIDEAVKLGREEKVELVWAVLNSPSMILMARQVALLLDVPLLTMVWDPPESGCRQNQLDRISEKLLKMEFDRVLNTASACAVASEGMKRLFEKEYEVPSRALISTPESKPSAAPEERPRSNSDHITITYAGSIYARETFSSLFEALGAVNWRISGKDVTVRILGNVFNLEVWAAGAPARIEFLGHHSMEETIEILKTSDIAYLPYWFDPRFESAVQQCFPSKLATYLYAGCPVLYHGPRDSSPQSFIERYGAAVCVNSMEKEEILRALKTLAEDKGVCSRLAKGRNRALEEELNQKVFIARFEELLAISTSTESPARENKSTVEAK